MEGRGKKRRLREEEGRGTREMEGRERGREEERRERGVEGLDQRIKMECTEGWLERERMRRRRRGRRRGEWPEMRMVRRSGMRVNGSGWEEGEQEKVRVRRGGEEEAVVKRWSEMAKQRKRRKR